VFTYKDKGIKQSKTASLVADNFARELLRQVKGGKVTVVGRQDISERDVIQMPDELGGDYYYVGKVNHKMSGSDGYETVINCEGAVPEENVIVSKDLEDNETVYFDPEAESDSEDDGE
jgi:phage protein D